MKSTTSLLSRRIPSPRMLSPTARLLPGILILSSILASPAQATQLVPQNLKQMIQASDLIVTGEVKKLTDGIDHGVPYTEVTLKVKGSIKRDFAANSNYVFRQYGLLKNRKMADGRYLLAAKIEGMPTWKVGENVTAFMNKPALRTGLVTPVGMAQGKFTASGAEVANSFNNRGLFQGMKIDASVLKPGESAMLAKPSGAVQIGLLNGLVKRAVKDRWIENGVMR
jgi:hypothetical protein